MRQELLLDVHHRPVVFMIPKMLLSGIRPASTKVKASLAKNSKVGGPPEFFGLRRLTILIANKPASPHDVSGHDHKLMEYFYVTDGAVLSEDGQETWEDLRETVCSIGEQT